MINLKDLISPSFYSLHHIIKRQGFTHYWLKGGRGSTKSSFISIEIILGIMYDPKANCIAIRKVGVNLKDSVFEQLRWAISALDVEKYWKVKISPLELSYMPTGCKILFRGADSSKKIKSTKFSQGYCKYIWYEEVDEFKGMEEIRNINQSLMRGGQSFCIFYSYNPPQSQRNWVNEEILKMRDDRMVHHSTYLKVPRHWLGEQFFIEAEHLKCVNEAAFNHEYMGEVTGTGGEVFNNITIRTITDEEIKTFDGVARGLDWGYATDPFHYTVNHYDKTRRKLYIFFEIQQVGLSNRKAAELVKHENINNRLITCDSAEPKSIAEVSDYGLRVIGAKKGPDSVGYGIKWLQDLEEIVIDPVRCPNTAREFNGYELEKDANGNFKAKFPDKDNHSIDAVRYSRESDMKNVRVR
ncbi:MAG TPA: PBSX family phage terminase large subunit [Lachnospiraceae bacterium]|nr:PBSX family phage terminase large subunit [Lachnospiraceae bacterium]